MKILMSLIACLAFTLSAYGANSLLRYQDISKMRDLGVSQEVIHFLTTNQTSSIGSEDVIEMKRSGMTNDEIMSAIKSDLYRPSLKPTVMEEAELIANLKESGMSDEAILQFLDTIKTTRRVGLNGKVTQHYTSKSRRPQYPTSGTVFPEIKDYAYDPNSGIFHILVQPKPQ